MPASITAPVAREIVIELPKLQIQFIPITLIGDSPLICHAWSEKAKKEMLDKQMKKASTGRVAKDPKQDFRDSLYPHPDGGYGFPVLAFKNAAVTACSQVKGITKVQTRGAFHVIGEPDKSDLVKIESGEPEMREDMVRVGMGTADIRYRGEFKNWRVKIGIRYNTAVLSPVQIINLFNIAGFAVGVGEWRPEKDGAYGMWHVASEGE